MPKIIIYIYNKTTDRVTLKKRNIILIFIYLLIYLAYTCPEKNGRFTVGKSCDKYLECIVSILLDELVV